MTLIQREIPLETTRHPAAWAAARWITLAATLTWLGLVAWGPEPVLRWTWNVIVPLLPASFLLTPALWRNVCPLATLNELPHGLREPDRIPPGWTASGVLAVAALILLIPLRRALLNGDAGWTAGSVAGLGVVAAGLGSAFAARSGFCNSVCPVLPVERLYGQHPLVHVLGNRCASCTFCTPRGCVDLARGKAMAQVLGQARRSTRWLATPMGVFAAAFPGIVVAYFTMADAPAPSLAPWLRTIAFGIGSYALAAAIVLGARIRGAVGMTLLAALSFGLYYGFAATGMAAELGIGTPGAHAIRAAAVLLLFWWLLRAPPLRRRPTRHDPCDGV